MLTFHDGEIEVLPAAENKLRCKECGQRLASWKAKRHLDLAVVPYCGWCLMYGSSQWGFENRDEIRFFGEFVRGTALSNIGKNTHVPELDVRHRLNWKDAEHAIIGIVFTSRTMKMSFGRVALLRARAEELYGSGDQETGGSASSDVSAAESRAAGQAEDGQSG